MRNCVIVSINVITVAYSPKLNIRKSDIAHLKEVIFRRRDVDRDREKDSKSNNPPADPNAHHLDKIEEEDDELSDKSDKSDKSEKSTDSKDKTKEKNKKIAHSPKIKVNSYPNIQANKFETFAGNCRNVAVNHIKSLPKLPVVHWCENIA